MKNNMSMLDVNSQERGHRGFFTPLVFGSIALFLCMEVGAGECKNTGGGIGVCVDGGEDISTSTLGITWNGLQGKGKVYQPRKGEKPIEELSFNFKGQEGQAKATYQDDKLVTTIPNTSSTLEINGEGKSMQIGNYGNGVLKFILKDDGSKNVNLNLGPQTEDENYAFTGNLVLDNESDNSLTSGIFSWLGKLGSTFSKSSAENKIFTGSFRGKGIDGDVTLGAFGDMELKFGDRAIITGKVTVEAGNATIESTGGSTLVLGGIYSGKGQGTLEFKDANVSISGFLDSTGKTKNGDSAIVSSGGNITLVFPTNTQNISIEDLISTMGQNTSKITIKSSGNNSTLSLNGIDSSSGTNGINISLEGTSSVLILNKEIVAKNLDLQSFNFQGSGNISTTFKGLGSKVKGQVSFSGSGANSMDFEKRGDIFGDVIISISSAYTTHLPYSTRGNQIAFKNGGGIEGDVYSWGGNNTITFDNKNAMWLKESAILGVSGKVSAEGLEGRDKAENTINLKSGSAKIGGLEVLGEKSATNTVNVENGDLTIAPIGSGEGIGNALYANNPQGSNVINVKNNGVLTVSGDIKALGGSNHIIIQNGGASNLGEEPITITAGGGNNVFSFNNDDEDNYLKLKTITANDGGNYFGKNLTKNSDSTQIDSEKLKTENAFTGTMKVSSGINAEGGGKNVILFSAGHGQNSSIISHIDESNGLSLQNAVYGNNEVLFDLLTSSFASAGDLLEKFLQSPQTQADLKNLGESSAIFGHIVSGGGKNFLLIEGKEDGANSALFGNIITDSGNNNLIFKDSVVTPSTIITEDGSFISVGGKLSGNFTTTNGEAKIVTSVTHNPCNGKIFGYTLDAQGGRTDLFFDGPIDVEIDIKTSAGAKANLIFASSPKPLQYDFKGKDPKSPKDVGEGFQVELAGSQGGSPQAKVRSTYTDDSHNLTLRGVTMGNITAFSSSQPSNSPSPKSQSIILGDEAVFVGNIDAGMAKVEMNNDAKIFFHNFGSKDPKGKFSLPILQVNGTSHPEKKIPGVVISPASTPSSGENFNLLTIGNSDDGGKSQPKVGTGLQGQSGAMFVVRVNPWIEQTNAKLGGGNNGDKKLGNIYSDRIIVANIGDNSKAQEGVYYLGIHLGSHQQMKHIAYNPSNDNGGESGGSKQEGNIAVLTVVNTNDNKAGIDLQVKDTMDGFDQIGGGLTAKKTDINGICKEDGGFTTYFLDSMSTKGATNERGKASASALGSNYDLYIANFNSLNKRMGELRDNPYSQGVWARIFGGAQSNHFGLGTKTNYVTIQAGYDYAFGFEGANNYLGVALAYGISTSKVQSSLTQEINDEEVGFGNVKSSAVEVAIYNAYVQDEGWYNDSILKLSYITSSFNIFNQEQTYSTHNIAVTLSDEFGYRFRLGSEKEWFIDPQAEFSFGYFNPNELKQTLGESWLHGIAEGVFTLRTRIGSSFGYDFKKFTQGKAIKASVYVGVFSEYDYVTGGDVTFTTNLGGESNAFGAIGSDKRVVLNVGTNMSIKDNTRIYFDFEKSFAGKITTDYQVNVGVRYSFGENNGYTPIDESKKRGLPLRVGDGESHEEEEDYESEEGGNEEFQENVDGAKEGA